MTFKGTNTVLDSSILEQEFSLRNAGLRSYITPLGEFLQDIPNQRGRTNIYQPSNMNTISYYTRRGQSNYYTETDIAAFIEVPYEAIPLLEALYGNM